MRCAIIVALLSAAFAAPSSLLTAGNPLALNITHDEVVGDYDATPNGWAMYKQCDSAVSGV